MIDKLVKEMETGGSRWFALVSAVFVTLILCLVACILPVGDAAVTSADTGTADDPLNSFSCTDGLDNYRGKTVYVKVGGSVYIGTSATSTETTYPVNVTGGYGLIVTGAGDITLSGSLDKEGLITVEYILEIEGVEEPEPGLFYIQAVGETIVKPTSISISGSTSIKTNRNAVITATVYPENATDRTVTWSVVQGESLIYALDVEDYSYGGTATVTAKGTAGTVVLKAVADGDTSISKTYTISIVDSSTTKTLNYDWEGGVDGPSTDSKTTSGSSYTFTVSAIKPTKDGYTFLGWSDIPGGSVNYVEGDKITVTTTETLYAVWEKDDYTFRLYYDANGGTGGPIVDEYTSTEDYHRFLVSNNAPTKEGFSFLGWDKDKNAISPTYPYNGTNYIDVITTMTLYAVWESVTNTYTVTFSSNGGAGTIASIPVQSGTSITLPLGGFTKEGYYQSKWLLDYPTAGVKYDLGSSFVVIKDCTFYAKWEPITNYYDTDAPQQTELGSEYIYKPLDNGQCAVEDSRYGLYQACLWTGSYELVIDEKPSWLNIDISSAYTILISGTPTSDDVGANHIAFHMQGPSSEITGQSYIEWSILVIDPVSEKKYTISFDPNGGTGSMPSRTNLVDGTAIILPDSNAIDFERVGYTQIGWRTTDDNGNVVIYPLGSLYTVHSDRIFRAQWSAEPNVIIFDVNGGSGLSVISIAYNGDVISVPEDGLVKSGYVFAGWFLDSDPDTIYAPGFMMVVEGQIYFRAYWIPEGATTAKVVFNPNGGSGTLSQQVEVGKNVRMPSWGFTIKGAELSGWSHVSEGTNPVGKDTIQPISENTTFYAVYEGEYDPNTLTVTFNTSGGVGSYPPVSVSVGSKLDEPNDPSRSGFVFNGWKVEGGGYWDFSKPVQQSMTLIAQWTEHSRISVNGNVVTITFVEPFSGYNNTIYWTSTEVERNVSQNTISHTYPAGASGTIRITTMGYSADGIEYYTTSHSFGIGSGIKAVIDYKDLGNGKYIFTSEGSYGFTSLEWSLGQDIIGDETEIEYTFDESGDYKIYLKVSSGNVSDTTEIEIYVDVKHDDKDYVIIAMATLVGIIGAAGAFVITRHPVSIILIPVFIIAGWLVA